jgi:ACDE family multidrug resistance protein
MSESRLYRDRNLQIVFAVTLMAVLGVSSITPAFPRMREAWGISPQAVGLLITAFTVPGVILAPFIGILADRAGRKRLLVPSLFLFGIAGGACALTCNFAAILALRVIQGVGAVGLGSLNVTIIGDLFSGQQRSQAMGLNASVLSVGVAAYPAIGGALALLSCRYPFLLALIAIPVGIVALGSLRSPEPRNEQNLRDYLGGTWGYLKNLKVAGLLSAGVLAFIIIYGAFLNYLPLLLGEEPFEASPFAIGLILSGMAVSAAIVSSQLGRISRRIPQMLLVKASYPLYGVSLAMIPFMPSLWYFLLPAAVCGIAQAINIPSIQTEMAGLAPLEHRAGFMSVNAMMLRLGQTLGPPVLGLFYVYTSLETTFLITAVLAAAAVPAAIMVNRAIGGAGKAP